MELLPHLLHLLLWCWLLLCLELFTTTFCDSGSRLSFELLIDIKTACERVLLLLIAYCMTCMSHYACTVVYYLYMLCRICWKCLFWSWSVYGVMWNEDFLFCYWMHCLLVAYVYEEIHSLVTWILEVYAMILWYTGSAHINTMVSHSSSKIVHL